MKADQGPQSSNLSSPPSPRLRPISYLDFVFPQEWAWKTLLDPNIFQTSEKPSPELPKCPVGRVCCTDASSLDR